MHPRSILAVARKDALDILLNKTTLSLLLMPILLALLFLVISKLIGGNTTRFLVYNPGNSPLVQIVSKGFDQVQITEADSPAAVTAAFGPNGSSQNSPYAVGLIIPAHFESALQSGQRPQVSFYINGNMVNDQDSLLLQATIINYARQIANPQPPVVLSTSTINPPSTDNIGSVLGTYYSAASLVTSFIVGISLMPGLLIEEKERKTLRMLMVTPASFTDIILGKLLVALSYQILLSLIVLAIQGGFTGQIPLVLLYMLLGAFLSLALGLLLGGIFQTASTAGAVGGLLIFAFIIPSIFVGPLASLIGNNQFVPLVKILPTYYISEGVYNAMQALGTLSSNLLDIAVLLGTTLVLLAITIQVLRRQSSVAVSI